MSQSSSDQHSKNGSYSSLSPSSSFNNQPTSSLSTASISSASSPNASIQFLPFTSFKQQNCFLANIFNLPHDCIDEPETVTHLIQDVLVPPANSKDLADSDPVLPSPPNFEIQLFDSPDKKSSIAAVAMSSQATLISLVNGINGRKYKNFTLVCSIVPPRYPYLPQMSAYGSAQSLSIPFIPYPFNMSPGSPNIPNQWLSYLQEGLTNFHLSGYSPSQFLMMPQYNAGVYPVSNNFPVAGFLPHSQFGYYMGRRCASQRRHRNSSQTYRSRNGNGYDQRTRYYNSSNGGSVNYASNDCDSVSSDGRDNWKQREQKLKQPAGAPNYDLSGSYVARNFEYSVPSYSRASGVVETTNYKDDSGKDFDSYYLNSAPIGEPQESNTYVSEENLSTEELMVFDTYKHVDPTRIFIGNIPFTSTLESLHKFFRSSKQCGDGLKNLIMQHQVNGNFRGFAIGITKSQNDSVALIKEFNRKMFEGRELTVRFDKLPDQILKNRSRKDCDLSKEDDTQESGEEKVTETVEFPAKSF